MKYRLIILLLFTTFTMSAQFPGRPLEIPLWPEGAPTDNAVTAEQKEQFEGMRMTLAATDNPTLTIHKAQQPNGTAILACPGGAYIIWSGTGGHGWGYGDHFKYKMQWTGELEKWLREIK